MASQSDVNVSCSQQATSCFRAQGSGKAERADFQPEPALINRLALIRLSTGAKLQPLQRHLRQIRVSHLLGRPTVRPGAAPMRSSKRPTVPDASYSPQIAGQDNIELRWRDGKRAPAQKISLMCVATVPAIRDMRPRNTFAAYNDAANGTLSRQDQIYLPAAAATIETCPIDAGARA
jgi:hypothetical protein